MHITILIVIGITLALGGMVTGGPSPQYADNDDNCGDLTTVYLTLPPLAAAVDYSLKPTATHTQNANVDVLVTIESDHGATTSSAISTAHETVSISQSTDEAINTDGVVGYTPITHDDGYGASDNHAASTFSITSQNLYTATTYAIDSSTVTTNLYLPKSASESNINLISSETADAVEATKSAAAPEPTDTADESVVYVFSTVTVVPVDYTPTHRNSIGSTSSNNIAEVSFLFSYDIATSSTASFSSVASISMPSSRSYNSAANDGWNLTASEISSPTDIRTSSFIDAIPSLPINTSSVGSFTPTQLPVGLASEKYYISEPPIVYVHSGVAASSSNTSYAFTYVASSPSTSTQLAAMTSFSSMLSVLDQSTWTPAPLSFFVSKSSTTSAPLVTTPNMTLDASTVSTTKMVSSLSTSTPVDVPASNFVNTFSTNYSTKMIFSSPKTTPVSMVLSFMTSTVSSTPSYNTRGATKIASYLNSTRSSTAVISSFSLPGCGIQGDYTLDFDEIPPLAAPSDTADPLPLFSPYHQFYFSEGFAVVPPPTDPYLPSSGRLLVEFIPVEGGRVTGQLGNSFTETLGCFNFNARGFSLGCDSTGPDCEWEFIGLRYNFTTKIEDTIANQRISTPSCAALKDCILVPVTFDGTFEDLTSLLIHGTVAGVEKIWWMDSVDLSWYDSSCSSGLCRQHNE